MCIDLRSLISVFLIANMTFLFVCFVGFCLKFYYTFPSSSSLGEHDECFRNGAAAWFRQEKKTIFFCLFGSIFPLPLIVPHLVLSLVFLLLLKTALSGLHEFQCEYWVCLTICFFFFVCVLLTITFQTKYQTQGGKKNMFSSLKELKKYQILALSLNCLRRLVTESFCVLLFVCFVIGFSVSP